jgi:uncharacterized membrane protein YeaQ/YmgE (transglycosylase-associated protein family)
MGFLSWILMGIVVGILAKWIMPGPDPGGIIITILLGVAGPSSVASSARRWGSEASAASTGAAWRSRWRCPADCVG